jgi:hypothetical protein
MVAIVAMDQTSAVLQSIRKLKHRAWVIGEVVRGRRRARIE